MMSLSPEQWRRVKAIFDAVLALDPPERSAFLARECGDDTALRQQVDTLLESHQRAPEFLETPAAFLFDGAPVTDDLIGRTIGSYRLVARIGAGGMGVVYKAEDSKLDRPVALKLMARGLATDSDRLRRFHAEARAASSLNHPQILVIHDFGEVDGRPFIVTEFVEGQTLRERMTARVIPVGEAVAIAIQVAGALAAAHARGLVHRDIKPENVMLRPDGYVKVLDFGLAKLMTPATTASLSDTNPGTVMGTPRYMSPEQARGLDVDARTDIWSLGVMLYEMLAGRPPFDGATPSDVMAAVLQSDPLLTNSGLEHVPAIVTAVVERALAKEAGLRYASAADMYKALTAARTSLESGAVPAIASPVTMAPRTRLIVLPFRVMRPDADTGFLAFSLPDAITTSLAGLQSLLVRPSITAARFGSEEPDIKKVASEADVDVVLSGTLLRAGDEIRVTTQLVDATAGTVILSSTLHAPVGDLFRLQDELTTRIVESLALPLTTRERRQLRHDVPATAKAYDFYLRANQAGLDAKGWPFARDLYLQAVEEDPKFAPAWARLARVYRLLAKYEAADMASYLELAENSLRKALALNPDLPMAHNLYAQLDADRGRAEDAVVRLLTRAKTYGADPEIYAGLVHACRYCGLLEASLTAHHLAVGLDVNQATSVMQTNFVLGRYEDVLRDPKLLKGYVSMLSLVALGRNDEAIATVAQIDQARMGPRGTAVVLSVKALAEGNRASSRDLLSTADLPDPEGLFYVARQFAYLGDAPRALDMLTRSIGAGYFAYSSLADSWFDPIRNEPEFQRLLDRAREGHESAVNAFRASGGPTILGLSEAKTPEIPTPVLISPRVRTRLAWSLVAAAIVAAIAFVAFRAISNRGAPPASAAVAQAEQANTQNRLVVLPFENLTRDAADDWLAGALADTLTFGLQSVDTLTLVNRERIGEVYRELGVSPTAPLDPKLSTALAQRFGLTYFVHGSYQRVGDQIKVAARIVSVESGQVRAQESVTDAFRNILQAEDQLSNKLAASFTDRVLVPSRVAGTASLEAYRLYSEAKTLYVAGELAGAQEVAERALGIDPQYAQAWALLSKTQSRAASPAYSTGESQEPLRAAATRAAQRAVEIDGSLYDAHAALALAYHETARLEEWRAEARKAIALNPREGEGYALLADSYALTPTWGCGRDHDVAKAEEFYATALRLDPTFHAVYASRAGSLQMANRLEEALRIITAGAAVAPTQSMIRRTEVLLRLELGLPVEFSSLAQLNTDTVPGAYVRAWADFARGDEAAAKQGFDRADRLMARSTLPDHEIHTGFVYLGVGQPTRAIAHFRRAVSLDPSCGAYIATVPLISRFTGVPELNAFVQALAPIENRLVVLPFENLSRNPADDWLAGGFSDTLTFGLQKLRTYTLVNRDRVAEVYRSQAIADTAPLDLAKIGRLSTSLGAQYYVHGTYQRVGNQLRVVARLAAVNSGEIKAQESVTDSIDNVLRLEDDLASRFAIALEGSPSRVERSRTRSVEAYQAYTDGRAQWEAGRFAAALPMLERAVALDANYEQAWALLSKVHSRLVAPARQTVDEEALRQHRREALRAAERAAALAPTYDDAHTALALAHRANEQVGPWRTEAQRAIELNPQSYEAHVLLGDSFTDAPLYTCRRTPDSALAEAYFRTAMKLDPSDYRAYEQLAAFFVITYSPETPATLKQLFAIRPNDLIGQLAQAQLHLEAKQADEAAAMLRPLDHQVLYVQMLDAWLHLVRGNRPAARELFAAAERTNASWALLSAAQTAFLGGDVDAARELVSKAITRDRACGQFMTVSKAFAPLRANPSIAALLRER